MFPDTPFLRLGIKMAVVFTLIGSFFVLLPIKQDIETRHERHPRVVTVQNRAPLVEIPTFPGCRQSSYGQRLECTKREYAKFVKANVQKMGARKGRILVGFTVDLSGKMQAPKLMRGEDPHLTAEVMRLVGILQGQDQRWLPGKIRGTHRAFDIGLQVSFGMRCGDCDEVTVDIVEW